jgi:rfaE bifunctional protein nucleotidyltransferase chain/domain
MSVFFEKTQAKIQDWPAAAKMVGQWQSNGQRVVFTNGCFDLLHYGHLHYLAQARDLGDRLVIGLNSSASVSKLKGRHRPINDELTRQTMLAALAFVDLVAVFEQDTPLELITLLRPDVLVKGGDWATHQIVGSELVLAKGGKVFSLPFVDGYSTTNIEQKIIADYLERKT